MYFYLKKTKDSIDVQSKFVRKYVKRNFDEQDILIDKYDILDELYSMDNKELLKKVVDEKIVSKLIIKDYVSVMPSNSMKRLFCERVL